MNAQAPLPLLVMLLTAVPASAQILGSAFQTKHSVMCLEFVLSPPEINANGFAKATLVSLWYARNAQQRANEIMKQPKTDTSTFLATAARIERIARNEYFCSREMLTPFTIANDANIKAAADALIRVYDAQIKLTDRAIQLANTASRNNAMEFMEKSASLEPDWRQRWPELDAAVAKASLLLGDPNHAAVAGKATRLVITKAQKQQLLNWVDQHFPEFKPRPQNSWVSGSSGPGGPASPRQVN